MVVINPRHIHLQVIESFLSLITGLQQFIPFGYDSAIPQKSFVDRSGTIVFERGRWIGTAE